LLAVIALLVIGCGAAAAATLSDTPFTPPLARSQYAPDRGYDLLHVALNLQIDFPRRTFRGIVTCRLVPLPGSPQAITLHCGDDLKVEECHVNGQRATFARGKDRLEITPEMPLPRGMPASITVRYRAGAVKQGFYWVEPTTADPTHMGFYTEGQPAKNHHWVPIWDYPNDFTTSETTVTVPADWFVVGNGALVSDTLDPGAATRTFHWRMDQPHASYLVSLAGGPFEVMNASWRGVPLMYVVPKGKGGLVQPTFGHTPDMLTFFSDVLGVPYPWPKYAQTVVYGYRSGLENVSATTLGDGALTDARSGNHLSDPEVAHELAHQWFGDLVTCKDWGELWLNEGFAVFFTGLYFEHDRGKAAYQHYVHDLLSQYVEESRRYVRPLATDLYAEPASMFDRHTYAKGAIVLHMLRRRLGPTAFFAGLRHYLTRYQHQPVDSHDLCEALTEATGVNLGPFFQEWVYSPGHPVLDYHWRWDGAAQSVVLSVRREQPRGAGSLAYGLETSVGLIAHGGVLRHRIRLDRPEQEIQIAAAERPAALLLDPDHDLLCDIPVLHWTEGELPNILRAAPDATDREEAMQRLLAGAPSDATIHAVVESLRADSGEFPVFTSIGRLGGLKRADLRPFFREQLRHPSIGRRAQAIRALGQLAPDAGDASTLRGMVNGAETYPVLIAAVAVLKDWDAAGNRAVFERALRTSGQDLAVRLAAYDALAQANAQEGIQSGERPQAIKLLRRFLSDLAAGNRDSGVMTPELRDFLFPNFVRGTQGILKGLKETVFLASEDADMVVRGAHLRRYYYFKVLTAEGSTYFVLRVTGEGKVGDIDIYPG
jgi:aminopeptidase N